jgi:pSer/pThr/pTyr-binding forkhead associated (FHA) protein
VNISVSKDNEPLFQVDLGKEIEGNEGAGRTFFVGRAESCQIVLEDKQVSREHARFFFEHGQWSIAKASDFNTLSINGNFSDGSPLKNGDLISIGPFTLNISNLSMGPVEVESTDGLDPEPTLTETDASGIDVGLGVEEATELIDEDDLNLDEETVAMESLDENELSDLESDDDLSAGFDDDFSDSPEGDAFSDSLDDSSGETEDQDFSSDVEESGDGFSDEFSDDGGFDDGFEEDNYDVESYDDDMDEKTQVIRSFAKFELELFGEFAPYDKFVLEKPETFIGRDPDKCDILLNDPEVSGVHSVIKKNAITCTLEDLKSANGTILNGERINSHELTNGDEFLVGSTSFTVKIQSDFIEQEKDRIMPVEENQVVEVEEVLEVDENFEDADGNVIEGDGFGDSTISDKPTSLFSKESLKDPQKRKKILIYLVGLIGLWVLLDDDPAPKKPVKPKAVDKKAAQKKTMTPQEKALTPEERELVEGQYLLAKEYFNEGKYGETIQELDKIFAITPNYKKARQIKDLATEGLERVTKLLEEERKEKERKIRALKIKDLLVKATEAVKARKISLSKSLFEEIIKLDPDNFEVTQLKLEISSYEKEQERIALEKAQKESERKRQVQELSPGKNFYLSKEWYKAILKLQDFTKLQGIDEDLMREATKMLDESRNNLNRVVNPLLGKARSLKEGQDLKGAYELYLEIVKYNPSHEEALNEMDEIREKLESRSKKVYREAIIAESLSLYDNAKEKFQEVQQISPTDSEYYQKATVKLKEYLD